MVSGQAVSSAGIRKDRNPVHSPPAHLCSAPLLKAVLCETRGTDPEIPGVGNSCLADLGQRALVGHSRAALGTVLSHSMQSSFISKSHMKNSFSPEGFTAVG